MQERPQLRRPPKWFTPQNGQATYSTSSVLLLTGFPFFVDYTEGIIIDAITIIRADTVTTQTIYNRAGNKLLAKNDTVIVYGSTPFLADDAMYLVDIIGPEPAYEPNDNYMRVSVAAQDVVKPQLRIPLLTTAQSLTTGFVDFGFEQNVAGYNFVGIYYTRVINNSANLQVKTLWKLDNDATPEYTPFINTAGDPAILAKTQIFEVPEGIAYGLIEIPINNIRTLLQIQAKVGTVGTTADTLTLELILG